MGERHLYITDLWVGKERDIDWFDRIINVFEERIKEAKRRNPDHFSTDIQVVFNDKHYYMVACEPDENHETLQPAKRWTIGDNSRVFWLDAYKLDEDDWKRQGIWGLWHSSECAAFVFVQSDSSSPAPATAKGD